MALSAKVGQFNTPVATGTQAITGVGFQPTFIFFVSGLGAAGAATSIRFSYGWTAGVGKDVAFYGFGVDNQSTTDCGRAHRRDFCIYRCSTALAASDQALLSSFDSDGFTLNWTAIAATGVPVAYLALGGDAVANAGAGPTIPTSGASIATTGVGFLPTALMLGHAMSSITPNANADDHFLGFGGASDSSTSRSFAISSPNGTSLGTTDVGQSFDQDSIMQTLTPGGAGSPTVDSEAALASFDADGFTLGISDNPAATVATSYAALRGVSFKVGDFAKPTAIGTQAITGVGFTPKAGIFWSQLAAAGIADSISVGMGVTDGTTEYAVGIGDADGRTTTTNVNRRITTTKGPYSVTSSAALAAEGDLQSWDADGFTINWTTANATAGRVGYMVFGDPAVVAGRHRDVIGTLL